MEPASSLRFASVVRSIVGAARALGLEVPAFRSPPRLPGADRTKRVRPDGGVTVAVRLRGRPWGAVVADLVEGVVVANSLTGVSADRARTALWRALGRDDPASPTVDGEARVA